MLISFLPFFLPIKIQTPLQGVPLIAKGMNLEIEVQGRKALGACAHPLRRHQDLLYLVGDLAAREGPTASCRKEKLGLAVGGTEPLTRGSAESSLGSHGFGPGS